MAPDGVSWRRIALLAGVVVFGVSVAVAAAYAIFGPKAVNPSEPPRVNIWALTSRGVDELVGVGGTDDSRGDLVVARTSDGGRTWEVLTPEAPAMTRVARAGDRLVASIWCRPPTSGGVPLGVGPASCVYVSDDDGASWRDVGAGKIVDPTFGDSSYGWAHPPFPEGGPLYQTTDGGLTWSAFAKPCPSNAPTIYAAVATSSEGGYVMCFGPVAGSHQPWSLVEWSRNVGTTRFSGNIDYEASNPTLDNDFVQGFTMRADGAGLIWTSHGIYASVNGGSTWEALLPEGLDRGFFRGGGTMPTEALAFLVHRGPYSSIVEWSDHQWRPLISWPFEGGPAVTRPNR
jgi:hypothetical protein